MEMEKENHWSIQLPWNQGLVTPREDRRIEPRNIFYASEIGKNFYEVFLAMKGTVPTNLAPDLARRKMEAGNIYEAIIVWALKRADILKESQMRVKKEADDKCLAVYGRADIVAGHNGNWDDSRKNLNEYIEKFRLMDFDFPFYNQVKKISQETVDYLSELYPNGLSDKIYEVKSLNSMAFWKDNQPIAVPYVHHVKQLSFYQNYSPIKDGSFLYIDRDTTYLSEIPNILKKEVIEEIEQWLAKMTEYYKKDITPPLPELIIWDAKYKKYSFNWEIGRSPYKDLILKEHNVKEANVVEIVNSKNKKMRKDSVIDSVFKGKNVRGTKKYYAALELIKNGASAEEIQKRTGVSFEDIVQMSDRLKTENPNQTKLF